MPGATRSHLQRETFSMRPSAAQGAGCRFAEGRRISQLFSLCLELTLPAHHSPETETSGCECGDISGREVAVRAHTSAAGVRPRGIPGPDVRPYTAVAPRVTWETGRSSEPPEVPGRATLQLQLHSQPPLPTEVPRGGTYVLSPGWRMAACGSKAWTLCFQSSLLPPHPRQTSKILGLLLSRILLQGEHQTLTAGH